MVGFMSRAMATGALVALAAEAEARTAAIYHRPSRVFEEQIKNGRVAALALADATPLQGGVPVLVDGRVVGAVGVSGDWPQADEDIAIAGAKAIQ